jgi:hypothetical protein
MRFGLHIKKLIENKDFLPFTIAIRSKFKSVQFSDLDLDNFFMPSLDKYLVRIPPFMLLTSNSMMNESLSTESIKL